MSARWRRIDTEVPLKIVVFGQGYVGLSVAIRAVEAGFDLEGLDLAEWKIDGLKVSVSHIDDIIDDDVDVALATGRYHPTAFPHDVVNFDIAVITVPTPLRDGAPDMAYVGSACRLLAGHLRTGATVVLESTTYPGNTEVLAAPILEAGSRLRAGADFHLGVSPERIDPGNQTSDFRRTTKILSGIDDASLADEDLPVVPKRHFRTVETRHILKDLSCSLARSLVDVLSRHLTTTDRRRNGNRLHCQRTWDALVPRSSSRVRCGQGKRWSEGIASAHEPARLVYCRRSAKFREDQGSARCAGWQGRLGRVGAQRAALPRSTALIGNVNGHVVQTPLVVLHSANSRSTEGASR